MGNFCEAFGIEKIEAPSTARKRIIKKKAPPNRPFRPKPKATPTQTPAKPKPKPKGKGPQKTAKNPIICYKCGKPGHKSFQCKTEQKRNEIFAEDSQMKAKLLSILLQNTSDNSEEENNYYSESTDSE